MHREVATRVKPPMVLMRLGRRVFLVMSGELSSMLL
jgi:hypothetical protein